MKKVIKEISVAFCLSSLIGVGVYLFFTSFLLSILISGFILFLAFIKPTYRMLNHYFRRSRKFKDYFDFVKFLDYVPQNIDIVNLGSSSGNFDFEYDKSIKGLNWALAPQTLYYDFNILKQYYSFLKPNATVIFSLCPFSSCITNFTQPGSDLKYYSFLHPAMICEYSEDKHKTIRSLIYHPILMSYKILGLKKFLHSFLASVIKHHPCNSLKNTLSEKALEKDANNWIEGWKNQFQIESLDSEKISEESKNSILFNGQLISDIAIFCNRRDLNLVFILPPMTSVLSSNFSGLFRENYIYSLFSNENTSNLLFLNYIDDKRFSDKDLYFNSYFLNARGRKLFTNQVLKDIKLL